MSRLKCETASPHLTLPMYPIIPLFYHSTIQIRCWLCETNPNLHPWARIGGASPTLQVDSIAPNEPNSARPGLHRAKCAKRSQFGRVRPGPGGRLCKTNPISESWPAGEIPIIPLFHRSSIPIRCLSCETKPMTPKRTGMVDMQGNCMWAWCRGGMGFQPMNHRQDADATDSHGQDARATGVRNAHVQLPWVDMLAGCRPAGRQL